MISFVNETGWDHEAHEHRKHPAQQQTPPMPGQVVGWAVAKSCSLPDLRGEEGLPVGRTEAWPELIHKSIENAANTPKTVQVEMLEEVRGVLFFLLLLLPSHLPNTRGMLAW